MRARARDRRVDFLLLRGRDIHVPRISQQAALRLFGLLFARIRQASTIISAFCRGEQHLRASRPEASRAASPASAS